MSILKDVQFSIFTNSRIEPTTELVNSLLTDINAIKKYEFVPNLITNKNVDLIANTIQTNNNISFVTLDQSVNIACMNERIDVTIRDINNSLDNNLDDYIAFARSALVLIMEKTHVYSNRLAINVSYLSKEVSDFIQNTGVGKKLCKTLDFYKNQTLVEWSTRANVRKCIRLDNDELLNIITDISSVIDNHSGKNRFLCHMDINTVYENTGYRFSSANIEQFEREVLPIINEIKKNYEEVNNG